MMDSALEVVLKRDRFVLLTALGFLTALAWAYLLWLAAPPSMPGMNAPADMSGMGMSGMSATAAPGFKVWTMTDFAFMLAMWAVMMIGMMTPSAAPMILIYARVGRQSAEQGRPFAATGWFAGGYFLAWIVFAVLATYVQGLLERALVLTPMMALSGDLAGGAVLIAIGLYQWTPLKDVCLVQCQSPLSFIQRHGGFKRDALGSFTLGVRHGAYCIGCCWALMALLFVGGVMNVLWIAGISILVLAEKVLPGGRTLSRTLGVLAVVAGVYLIARRFL